MTEREKNAVLSTIQDIFAMQMFRIASDID